VKPSLHPSALPSHEPSVKPSSKPSILPSNAPSRIPSQKPSDIPSSVPSELDVCYGKGYVLYKNGTPADGASCGADCCVDPDGGTDVCSGFTGLVCKNGACVGKNTCRNAIIGIVGKDSCRGESSCENAKITGFIGRESCTGLQACYGALINIVDESSCTSSNSCKDALISEISGNSCTRSNSCRSIIFFNSRISGGCCNADEVWDAGACGTGSAEDCCGLISEENVENCVG
jgi:hypothetical protein